MGRTCAGLLPHSRGGTDSPKMTKNQKCQCYQSFLGSVLYLKTGGDFSFCQKVRLTPCTGGPKILTVFGIFIDKGPLGENAVAEYCQLFELFKTCFGIITSLATSRITLEPSRHHPDTHRHPPDTQKFTTFLVENGPLEENAIC